MSKPNVPRRQRARCDKICENCGEAFKAKQTVTRFCYEEECIHDRYLKELARKRAETKKKRVKKLNTSAR